MPQLISTVCSHVTALILYRTKQRETTGSLDVSFIFLDYVCLINSK